MSKELTVVAKLKAKPEFAEELGQYLYALVEPSRSEADCLNYDLHQSNNDPSIWLLYENWTSKEALDDHFDMPYLRAFLPELNRLLAEDMTIEFYSMRSAPA
jgi:quinol monooxygenase YgiN